MTTSRWNIINNAEFTRIARDLSSWIQFETNAHALLLSIAEEIKKENLSKDPSKSTTAQSSSWWFFSRNPVAVRADISAKPELDIFVEKLQTIDKYDIINRFTALVEFLERDNWSKLCDSSKFLAKLSKKHSSYDADHDFSEKVLAGVKVNFIEELKKSIGLTRMIPAPPPPPSVERLTVIKKMPNTEKGYFLQNMYSERPEDKAMRSFTIYLYLTQNKLEYAVKNAEGKVERFKFGNELDTQVSYGIKEILKDKNQAKKLNDDQVHAIFEVTSQRGYKALSKDISTGVNFALGSEAIQEELRKKWQQREEKRMAEEKKFEDEAIRLGDIDLPDALPKDEFDEEASRLSRMKF